MFGKELYIRIWNSPTIATWASFLSRPLNLLLLTPLIVTKLTIEESAVWFLMSVFLNLQSLADLGLNSSLTRAYAYSFGGATNIQVFKEEKNITSIGQTNWKLAEKINSTVNYLLFVFALLYSLILFSIGSYSLKIPIERLILKQEAWIAWGIIIVSSAINIFGNKYSVYIKGMNQVALFMRWRTLFAISSILFSALSLYLFSSLLILVVVYQFWIISNVILNRKIAHGLFNNKYKYFKNIGFDIDVFKGIFPSAWRTWIAQFMSFGLIQISGIFYAQIGDPSSTAMYLLSLKVINFVKQFSNAPFYSRLPLLAKYFIEKKIDLLLTQAKRGMFLAHLTFAISFIFIGIGMNLFLQLVGSKVEFATPTLWLLLGVSFWFERYGAMHYQLYGITNHIIAHIGNAVTGSIYIVLIFLLIQRFHILTFPIAYGIACLLFYSWYGSINSHKFFKYNYFNFEFKTSFFPLLLIIGYSIFIILKT